MSIYAQHLAFFRRNSVAALNCVEAARSRDLAWLSTAERTEYAAALAALAQS